MTKIKVGDILRVKRDSGAEQDLVVTDAVYSNGAFLVRPLSEVERERRAFADYLQQAVNAAREGKLRDWKIERKFNYDGATTQTNISFKGEVPTP